jgi:hypothetical protein
VSERRFFRPWLRTGKHRRRWTVALALLAVTGLTGSARAAPRLQCWAQRAGERALVAVTMADLLDADLRRLIELGLAGRLRIETTLHRRRAFWFDDQVASEVRHAVLSWSRERAGLLLDGKPAALDQLALPLLPLRPARGALDPGEHYVDVNLRLEVVTSSSLGEVARWLVAGRGRAAQGVGEPSGRRQEPGDEEEAPLLPRALVGALASDLARTARGRCVLPAAAGRPR